MQGIHVYLDIDDVLAETTRAMAVMANQDFKKDVHFDDMTVFDLVESLGLSDEEFPRFMDAVHEDTFLFGLSPMRGAIRAVSEWFDSGAEISVVTGRPPGTRAVTRRWLDDAGLPYHRLELIDKYGRFGEEATATKDDLQGRDYALVIEDSPEMADFLVEHTSALVLLMDRPWNRRHSVPSERVRRVHYWAGIAKLCTTRFGR